MKAWAIERHGGLDELVWRDVETPTVVRGGDVLVRVRAAAVNPADWKVLTGRDGGKFLHASRFPLALGYDFSGVVEAVGADVGELAKGDEVFGFLPYSRGNRQGSFAELVVAAVKAVANKPADVAHVAAACVATCGCTALQALRDRGGLRAQMRVLVNGASGGVGSYAVPIAKHAGAEVWGTASQANLDYLEALGSDYAVDYRETAPGALEEPFDIVLDAAGASTYGECAAVMQPGAAYVTLLPSLGFVTGWLRSLLSSKKVRFVVVRSRAADLAQLGEWLRDGVLPEAAVGATYPMSEVPAALERFKQGEVTGKIGIEVA